ncbi:MAG: preprotein translocase subunit SecG [Firmicutes bacterium]|nr:preprotein translocase subunit SecG [Bacillota bacterium]
MHTGLVVFQFVISIALIAVVLLQPSKGEGMGSIGGGGRLFFSKNKKMEDFLNAATSVVAVLFLVSSVLLTVIR